MNPLEPPQLLESPIVEVELGELGQLGLANRFATSLSNLDPYFVSRLTADYYITNNFHCQNDTNDNIAYYVDSLINISE